VLVGLRIGRLTELPADLQLPAEHGELVSRPARMTVDPGLAIPQQLTGQRPKTSQAASDAGQQILGLLGEHHHPCARAREPQARNHHPPDPGLTMPDRGGCHTSN
jgi:hypothetical protein